MPEVAVRRSRIGGLGVFAVRSLGAGELIRELELGREITRDTPLRPGDGEYPEHCTVVDGRLFLVGSPDRYFNHACDPNAYLRFAPTRTEVIARRKIEEGDELTIDYLINNAGGDSWPCRCGAPRCRGETHRSFFDLPEALQREYLPLLAPWFLRRHSRELERIASEPAGA